MKGTHLIILGALTTLSVSAQAAGSHAIRGYATKSGTYVAPSRATNPNNTRADNYSKRGNVNPYTGQAGTK